VAVKSTLLTAYENAVAELAAARAAYSTNGERPNFSLDGVSVDWPTYERHLIDQAERLLALYLAGAQMEDGPCVVYSQGR